jgi:transcriptional regulator with XRE-family HTH domain
MTSAGPTDGTGPAEPIDGAEPTALRTQLGARLRRLRQEREFTRERAGWEIRASESKISRMELGRVPFKERDVADLLALYGVRPEERAEIMALARRAGAAGTQTG